jgi:hypothetical protein
MDEGRFISATNELTVQRSVEWGPDARRIALDDDDLLLGD